MKTKYKYLTSLLVLSGVISLVSCGNASEKKDIQEGTDKIIENLSGKPDQNDAEEVIFAALGKLNSYSSYKKISATKTDANKGFINYTQNTSSLSIKNSDEYYVDSTSSSSFVNMEHEAFYKDDKVAFRNEKGDITNVKYAEYYAIYGISPNKLLSGQIFNKDTIVSASLESSDGFSYTYLVELDKELANACLIRQMKQFGNLKDYPVFTENTKFELTIEGDYTPISYSYTANYDISVPLLGNMSCKEETVAQFTNYGESVSIPDSKEFIEAINGKVTSITEKKIEVSEEAKDILKAIFNLNVLKGVSIEGNLNINGFQLPIELNLKADLEKMILNKTDFKSVLDMTFIASTMNGVLKITYHENKLYVDAFNKRYVFNLPVKSNDLDIETLQNIFKVKKDSSNQGKYILELSSEYNELIQSKLVEIGFLDEENSNFNFGVSLNIKNNKIADLSTNLSIGEKNFSSDLIVKEESYVLPNLENYETKINLKNSLSVVLQDKLGEILNGDIYFSYNTEEIDFLKAITLDAKLKIDEKIIDSIKSIASMTDLPSTMSAFYNAQYCNFIIKDGNFYIVATSENDDVVFYKKTSLSLNNKENESNSLFNDGLISDFFKLLDFSYSKNGISFKMSEENLDLLNSTLPDLYDDSLYEIGVLGTSSLFGIFGLYRRISSVELNLPTLDLDNFEMSLAIDAYDMSQKDVYNEKLTYKTSNLFNINLKREEYDPSYKFNWNFDEIEKNNEIAQGVIQEIKHLQESFSLNEDYYKLLESFGSSYNSLSNEVKSLVYNANVYTSKGVESVTDNLKLEFENEKKVVEQFAKNCMNPSYNLNSLNNTYKTFTYAELEYLYEEYKEALDQYISRREESEVNTVKQIESQISALEEKDVSTLNPDELYKYFNSLVNIYKQIDNCLPSSIQNLDLSLFESQLCLTSVYYYVVYSSLADDYVNEMKSFKDGINMSVSELNEYYSKLEKFYSKYYTALNISSISEAFDITYPDFEAKMYRVELYLKYNGHGFLAGAVKAIEEEIDDILENEYDTQVLESKIADLKKLLKKVNTSNVSNYDKIVPIIETLESKEVKEKLVEYTNAINELLLNGTEDNIYDFFDWGWGDYQYDDIKSFYESITYIQKLNNEEEYKALAEALEKIEDKKPDDFDW